MINVICPQYCCIPYCQSVCPAGAISVSDKRVSADSDKCYACGLCKAACLAWSRDKNMEKRSLERMAAKG